MQRTRGSGAGNQKGDAWSDSWFLEAKATKGSFITVQGQWWRKAKAQAERMQKPYVALGIRVSKRDVPGALGAVFITRNAAEELCLTQVEWRASANKTLRIPQAAIAALSDHFAYMTYIDGMELALITERTFRRVVINELI